MILDAVKLEILRLVQSLNLQPDTIVSDDLEYTLLIPVSNGRITVHLQWAVRSTIQVSYTHLFNGARLSYGPTIYKSELENQLKQCLQFAQTQPIVEHM